MQHTRSGGIIGILPAVNPVVWFGPASGLTHRWSLDDTDVYGGVAYDLVGTDNGVVRGGVASGTGPSSATQARTFDGVSGTTISLASNPITLGALTTPFSVGVWLFWPDITFNNGAPATPRAISFTDGTNSLEILNDSASADGGDPTTIMAQISNGNVAAAPTFGVARSGVLANSTWYNAVATFDGASTFLLYLNASLLTNNVSLPTGVSIGGSNGAIGNRADGSRPSKASIAQVVVYNRVISATEVTQLYNSF